MTKNNQGNEYEPTMTRKDIEELNVSEPYCFETDREEQWYLCGLVEGLNVADAEPKPNNLNEARKRFQQINEYILNMNGENREAQSSSPRTTR